MDELVRGGRSIGKALRAPAVIAFVVAAVLAFVAAGGRERGDEEALGGAEQVPVDTPAPPLPEPLPPSMLELQNSFRAVSQAVLPVVVEVNVTDVVRQQPLDSRSPFEFFFGPRRGAEQDRDGATPEFRRQGIGSGVIVRRNGGNTYVLTNAHVVQSAEEVNVRLNDGRRFAAAIVGTDERKDLALLVFVTDQPVAVAELGSSATLQVGDWVLAVGNPYGFESTVTAGIVSAIGRQPDRRYGITGYTEYIQTDAAINQGNSGGALVNIYGQVVGINSWIASPSGGNIGLGFAIPVDVAKSAVDDFIAKGRIEYGWLGVTIGDASTQVASELRLPGRAGSLVHNVVQGSPAHRAGVLPGDFVTQVGGQTIKDSTDLALTVGNLRAGDAPRITVVRDGKAVTLTAVIAAQEEGGGTTVWPGLSVVPMNDATRRQLNVPESAGRVVVAGVEAGGPAARSGLRTGDIVSAVNGKRIRDLQEFYRELNRDGTQVDLSVHRAGSDIKVVLAK